MKYGLIEIAGKLMKLEMEFEFVAGVGVMMMR